MKKRRNYKYDVMLLSGVIIGLLGGILIAPKDGNNVRNSLLYKLKRLPLLLGKFFGRIFSQGDIEVVNEAKNVGNEVIKDTKTKAMKLLEDVRKVTG